MHLERRAEGEKEQQKGKNKDGEMQGNGNIKNEIYPTDT